MTEKKYTGSYYTPDKITHFIINRLKGVLSTYQTEISVLEPSVGDGAFLKKIYELDLFGGKTNIRFKAIDINQNELNKAQETLTDSSYFKSFICQDFLEHSKNEQDKYNLIIGNPPYIKKHFLTDNQIELCQEIHREAGLSNNTIKNIWSAFLVKSIQLLDDNGILALVLPSELLQVKFAEELRNYLSSELQRVEIYTFTDLLFECKGQDTIIVIGFKEAEEQGVFYANLDTNDDIEALTENLQKRDVLLSASIKWTHHTLSNEELTFLHDLKSRLQSIDYYCETKPGIVTAANKYFIINEQTENNYGLNKYTQSILQKGFFVNGGVTYEKVDYQELKKSKKPSKVLCFSESNISEFNENVLEYLKKGEEQDIPSRYKCQIRQNWFVIPNIGLPPDGFFFKRSHQYPKLLKNNANVLVTDSAYKIEMKNKYNIMSLIFSFYNTLTLIYSELDGRYYGGGVLELTPKEFKKLPLPYTKITEHEFNDFAKIFKSKKSIDDILELNDYRILNRALGLDNSEITLLRDIRDKLIKKRIR